MVNRYEQLATLLTRGKQRKSGLHHGVRFGQSSAIPPPLQARCQAKSKLRGMQRTRSLSEELVIIRFRAAGRSEAIVALIAP